LELPISRFTNPRTKIITHPVKNNMKPKASDQAPVPAFEKLALTLIKAPITPVKIAYNGTRIFSL